MWMILFVWQAAIKLKARNICLSIVVFLALYGSMSGFGLVFQVLITTSQAPTFLNLQIIWVGGGVVDHFFNFCGFFVCGSYGKNVIIEFLIMFILPLWSFQKNLSSTLIGG